MAPCVWDAAALQGMQWVGSDDNAGVELPQGALEDMRLSPGEELECPSRCLGAYMYQQETFNQARPLPTPSSLHTPPDIKQLPKVALLLCQWRT